jgi:hypothetical protein
MTTISMHGTKLTDIYLSHSMKCPLGGGFWVYAPEQGHIAGCNASV